MLHEARGYQLVYFEDFTDGDEEDFLERNFAGNEADPLEHLLDKDMREVLVRSIEDLPEREKLVMGLYYEQDLNLREIGNVLGVTESRVCQLHSQAIARLRSRIFAGKRGREKAKNEGAPSSRSQCAKPAAANIAAASAKAALARREAARTGG